MPRAGQDEMQYGNKLSGSSWHRSFFTRKFTWPIFWATPEDAPRPGNYLFPD